MSNKLVFAFGIVAIAASFVLLASDQAAIARAKKAVAHRVGRNYFVPPPPPYAPSIFSDVRGLYNGGELEAAVEPMMQTPETRWSKYIYVRPGYQVPQASSQSRYVTNWNKT